MYLKNIELIGFKSFVDKTNINLEEGITCIVGPNGSGKSNISDAIRWVLGEQSARNLRGGKMEDIIFAGSAKRKSVGMAAVTLTLDNTDGTLPLEFNEVTVTRRTYRNGDSEYLINGGACRLKDIHNLFVDTGIGNDGVAMIGQGRVNQIVDMKADDRRVLIEEAAGIVRYRNRKKTAVRKLIDTERNLERINDILVELGERVEPLKIQAEKAEKYLELSEIARTNEINLMVQNIAISKNELDKQEKAYVDDEKSLVELNQKAAGLAIVIESNKKNLFSLEEIAKNLSENFNEKNETYHNIETELLVARANKLSGEENIIRLNHDIESLKNRDGGFMEQVEILSSKKITLISEIEVKTKENEVAQEQLIALNEKIEDRKAIYEASRTDAFDRASDLVNFRNEYNNELKNKDNINRNLAEMQDDLSENTALQNTLKEQKEELKTQLNQMEEEFINNKTKLSSLKEEIETNTKQKTSLAEEEVTCRYKLNSLNTKLNMLRDMEQSFEGYYPGVKAVLQERNRNPRLNSVVGVVADLIKVDPQYQIAIEAVLGGALQNIVTTDDTGAKAGIAFLKERRAGRATFLPASNLVARNKKTTEDLLGEKGVIGRCSDVVAIDAKYKNVANFLLGQVLLVENLDVATTLARRVNQDLRAVTLEGDIINPGGAMTGGSKNRNKNDLLSRKGEIAKLTAEVDDLTAKEQAYTKKLSELTANIETTSAIINDLNEKSRNFEMNKLALTKDYQHKIAELERANTTILLLKEDIALETKEISAVEISINKLKQEIENWDKANEAISQEIKLQEQAINEANEELKIASEVENQQKIDLAKLQEKLNSLDIEINRLKSEKADVFSEDAKRKDELNAYLNQDGKLTEKIKNNEANLLDLGQTIANLKEAQVNNLNGCQDLEELIAGGETEYKKITEESNNYQETLHKIEVRKARLEADFENADNKLREVFEISYELALEYLDESIENKELEQRVKSLKRQINALGNVNIDAIEEYKETSERFEFLGQQHIDLLEAKAALNKIIDEMDKIMARRFAESFSAVSDSFNSTFSRLFGGGSAGLSMTDKDNILETGVDIMVELPGKKVNNYNLLSGGEKALIGVALLLAIFKVRPAPFCILDEADAALDEANVQRFGEYIHEHRSKTQFVIISHRQGTMEVAANMWGVTMEEEGVSKTVSVRLEDAMASELIS